MDELIKAISPNLLPAFIIIAILMPFWYIAIYLFHKEFYEKSTQLLKWVFCYCFSIIWFIAATDISLELISFKAQGSFVDLYLMTGILGVGLLFINICSSYVISKFIKMPFLAILISMAIVMIVFSITFYHFHPSSK